MEFNHGVGAIAADRKTARRKQKMNKGSEVGHYLSVIAVFALNTAK